MYRPAAAGSQWTRVQRVAAVLFVSALVPAPVHDPPRRPPFGVDKLLHFSAHVWLGVVLVRALETSYTQRDAVVVAVATGVAYGVVLEAIQEVVPGRRFETGDVLAGAFGSFVGALAPALVGDCSTATSVTL